MKPSLPTITPAQRAQVLGDPPPGGVPSAASVASCEKSRSYTVRIGSIGVHFPPENELDLRAIAECHRYPVTVFDTWEAAHAMAKARKLDPEVFTIRLEKP